MSRRLILVIALCALFSSERVFAQSLPPVNLSDFGYKNTINLGMDPEAPGPGEKMKFTVDTSLIDLDRSEIVWSVNGVVKAKKIGQKTFELIAGKLGEQTTVSVKALPPLGVPAETSVSFIPGDVDLIWQAKTFTPPFYNGKAMYVQDSSLQVVAVPHIVLNGREISPKSLVYTWKVNGGIEGDASGFGKNVLSIPSFRLPQDLNIEVTASTYDDHTHAFGKTTITPIQPKGLIYVNHPRHGILLNRAAVGDITMKEQEINLMTYPYFFSAANGNEGLVYDWSINRLKFPEFTKNSITLRNTENQDGDSLIALRVKSIKTYLQFSDTNLLVHFTNQEATTSKPF